jgi:hypothetical protein
MSDTPSSQLHARLRDVADAVRSQANVAVPKQTITRLVWAVVVTVNAYTVDVAPGGATDGSQWSDVSFQGWYQPTEGDNVLVMVDGSDRIILGTMAGAGGGIQSSLAYAILGPIPNQTFPGVFVPSGNAYVVGAKGKTSAGSLTMKVQVNGSDVTGLTGLSVTTSATAWTCTPYRIPNLTEVRGVSTSSTGTGDMSFSILTATV